MHDYGELKFRTDEVWWEEGELPFYCPYWRDFFGIKRQLTADELVSLQTEALEHWKRNNKELVLGMVEKLIEDPRSTALGHYIYMCNHTTKGKDIEEKLRLQHIFAGMIEGTAVEFCGLKHHAPSGDNCDFMTVDGRRCVYI